MPLLEPPVNEIYTISRLNRAVRMVLEEVFEPIWVQGEISNFSQPSSGHIYFTLKDTTAQVRCALFKNRQTGLDFDLKNGIQVLARADISIYEGRGEYQLIIESLRPVGAGTLQLAFEALKQKLSREGLFDTAHKKTIPSYPEKIGIITSITGAALRDILSVLKRRYPLGSVIIYPVPVQGEGAAKKIAGAISLADKRKECDVFILARGGGSLEDLWSFNEEIVAHAIHACQTPMVCGIGHEIDFTIADFVADQRAPTPSAAAELVSPDSTKIIAQLQRYQEQIMRIQKNQLMHHLRHVEMLAKQIPLPKQYLQQLFQHIDECSLKLTHQMDKEITNKKNMLTTFSMKIGEKNPLDKIKQQMQFVNNLQTQYKKAIKNVFHNSRKEITKLKQILETLGPTSTLARGYALVTEKRTGVIVKDSSQLNIGDPLCIHLLKAEIESTIDEIHEK